MISKSRLPAQLPALAAPTLKQLCLCGGVCVLLVLSLRAQTSAASGPLAGDGTPTNEVHANPDEVLIDLVVRDKRNKPVTNLSPADIKVSDAGNPVQLADLHLVTPESGSATTIALLFDRMSPESAKIARDIAMKLMAMAPEKSAIAVLGVDRGLRLLENFTQDRIATGNAVNAALGEMPQQELADAEKQLLSIVRTGSLPSGAHASVEDRAKAQMVLTALEESQRIVQDQHAAASLAGLLALSKAQQGVAGRKIVVFFSEGLRANSNTETMTRDVVQTANRAGVSIYTVDTNAVDAKAFDMLTMMYQPTGRASPQTFQANPTTGLVGTSSAPTGVYASPDVARMGLMGYSTQDAHSVSSLDKDRDDAKGSSLAFLAKGTGGFSISGGDKSKEPLQRLIGDIGTYYEASYTPVLKDYDGQFHSLDIEPLRGGVTVRSRAGYFALPPDAAGAMGVRPFETPMLKILRDATLPADVLFQQAVLCMGGNAAQMTNELAIEVPLSQVEFHEDPNTQLYSGHFSILTQVRDKSGVVVERFSEDDTRKGALESLDAARADSVTMQRHFTAAPGNYVLEAVVLDRNGGKAGALRTEFTVPAPAEGPWLSDVVQVRRMMPIAGTPDPLEPLQYDKARGTPNLSHKVAAGTQHISFLFRVHGNSNLEGGGGQLDVDVERDGNKVSHSAMEVPGSAGGIGAGTEDHLNLATIEAGALKPGIYRAVFRYSQGEKNFTRTSEFTVDGEQKASAEDDSDTPEDASADEGASTGDLESGLGHYVASPGGGSLRTPSEKYRSNVLAGARERALGYLNTLMNFKCIEVTDRYVDRKGTGTWSMHDKLAELVTYENHDESRKVLEVNGDPGNTKRADMKGGRLDGEFGGVLEIAFDAAAKADFTWKEKGELDGNPVEVFSYHVEAKNSKFSVTALPETPIFVAFHGLVYIDAATRGVRRITIEAEGIPEKSPVHASAITIDYDYVAINNHDYLMPVRGEMRMQLGKRERILHRIEFRDYHRFGSEVRIVGVDQK
jgi:VWFA-related protein